MPREHIHAIGGAAPVKPHPIPEAQAPDLAARQSVQNEEQDFPLVIANKVATGQQKAVAAGVAVFLVVAAAVTAPFASIQLGRVDAFIPVLQTALSIAEIITAALLLAQYSIQPQAALLALASGYIFSGSFAFLQTLAFPGGYAPDGLIGDGPNSPAWIYILWHTTFPAAILIYALCKEGTATARPNTPVAANIAITIACVLAAITVLTWIVTTKTEYIPSFYTTDIKLQTRFGNQVNLALWLWGATALAVLFVPETTILDLWLMVTLLAGMPNFLVAMIGSSVRFTVGWYAARGFVLFSSCLLLTVLLIETMFLYSRLASVMTLRRREYNNRLLSVEAVTGALAHELNGPLAAIALNADTALCQLQSTPRELDDLEDIFATLRPTGARGRVVSNIREMTNKTFHRNALASADDVAQLTLRLLKYDLEFSEISVTTEFQGNLPEVQMDSMELQQVL